MASAARIVLRDWSIGKFNRYTTPPPAPVINNNNSAATVDTMLQSESSSISPKLVNPCDNITQLYVNDEAILSTVPTRKEKRKRGGLVKLFYGTIDPRKVAVEEPWHGLEQNDDEESDDDDDEGMDIDGEDEEEEKSEDEEDR